MPKTNYLRKSWSGYFANSSLWTANGTSFTDPLNTGGNTLTTRPGNSLSVTAAAGNLPGIVITPTSTESTYLVTASFGANSGGGGSPSTLACRLYDGTNEISAIDQHQADQMPVNLIGIWKPGTTSPSTIKIQLAAPQNAGNGGLSPQTLLVPSIEWTITEIRS